MSLGSRVKPEIIAVIVNLVSSYIYDRGKESGFPLFAMHQQEWDGAKLKKQLQEKLEEEWRRFWRQNEQYRFLDSDWFARFLQYQKIMEKLCDQILCGSNTGGANQTDEQFLDYLLGETRRAAEQEENSLTTADMDKARELYVMLMRVIHETIENGMPLENRYLHREIKTGFQEMKQSLEQSMPVHLPRPFRGKAYEYPTPHIRRYCTTQEVRLAQWLESSSHFCLDAYCKEHPRVVLLGEAGNGKTRELEWIAARFCEEAALSEHVPKPILVNLKVYLDETMEELALAMGVDAGDEKNLFWIIDGFDEIAGVNKQSFLKRLDRYQRQNPQAGFLISTRNQFYQDGVIGEGFETVWMEPLSMEDVASYVQEQGLDYQAWFSHMQERKITELLPVPFYLVELCEMYRERKAVPERGELMQELILRKFEKDREKYRMAGTMALDEMHHRMFELLEKLAVGMHAMDCKTLDDDIYYQLVEEQGDRELLKYSGVWNRQAGNWQFTHNNFGEYLAARYLARCPLSLVQTLVSSGHPELGIQSSWHHVLSYLLSMCGEDVWSWLLEQDFTLFFDVDWSRIKDSDRSKILIKEWNRLKEQHGWITRQSYRREDLLRFGMSYSVLDVFFAEVRRPADVIVLQNALLVLGACPNLFGREDETRQVLLEVLCNSQERDSVYEYAIAALLNQKLMEKETLSILMERFGNSTSSAVRYTLYAAIRTLKMADTYIDFLLEGIQYVGPNGGKGRLGNESFELCQVFMTVTSPEAACKTFRYITGQEHFPYLYKMDEIVKYMLGHLISAYPGELDEVWNTVANCYEKACRAGHHNIEYVLLSYFETTGTKAFLFRRQLDRVMKMGKNWIYLPRLLDEQVSEWIVEQYRCGNLTDEEAKCCIDVMHVKNTVYETLCKLYQERTGETIVPRSYIDYEVLRREGNERYMQALTNRERYLKLAGEILEIMGREDLTSEELLNGGFRATEYRYDLRAVAHDYIYYRQEQSIRTWMRHLKGEMWEYFQSDCIMRRMESHGEEPVPPELETAAKTFYEKYVLDVNFSEAIVWTSHTECQIRDWKAIPLLYFAWRLNLPMNREQAISLLDSVGLLSVERTRELLERYLTENERIATVRKNMKQRNLLGDVLLLHLRLCAEYKMTECTDYVLQTARERSAPTWMRQEAIRSFYALAEAEETCRLLLPDLEGELFLYAAEHLMEEQSVETMLDEPEAMLLADLLWDHSQKEETHQMRCYAALIRLQDIRGLQACREQLEREKKITDNSGFQIPVEAVAQVYARELWEELFALADLCFQPDFQDAYGWGLADAIAKALSEIAAGGEDGYQAVIAMLGDKRTQFAGNLACEARANMWMEDARWSYKQSVQRNWRVDEVKGFVEGR